MLLLSACGAPTEDTAVSGFDYPRDAELSLADAQVLGSHNSYHVETYPVAEWSYTHLPLDEQAESQGVRAFELDVNYDEESDDLLVYHFAGADEGTTCPSFVDCLATLKAWSDLHPAHQPLVVQLEMKEAPTDLEDPAHVLELLQAQIEEVWPAERRIDPEAVQGAHPSLREALAEDGWPTLGESRQRVLFGFDNGDWSSWATGEGESVAGLRVFPNAGGDSGLATAAWHVLNDPDDTQIAAAIAANQLVRTRADSDGEEARAGDVSRRDAAFASGAHVVSTDWPAPHPDTGYVVAIPGGTPSRCNPLHAPADCVAEDIEDPAFMGAPQ